MDQIKELEAKISDIKNQIGAIDRGEQDAGTRDQLVDQLNISTNQLAELTFNQEKKAAAIEEKVHAESVPFAIDGVDFTNLPAELIKVIELVVKADRRRIYAEHAEELQDAEDMYASGKADYGVLEVKYNELTSKLDEQNALIRQKDNDIQQLQSDNFNLNQQLKDTEQKRDAAASALEEANKEKTQLKSQVDDYQKAKVFGEREAQNVIEAEPAEAEEINGALKKLYVSLENWGTVHKAIKPDGTFDVVPTADLDNWAPVAPVFTPPTNGGSEDNNTFQDASETTIPGNEVTVPETQVGVPFPTPPTVSNEDNAGSGDTALSTMVGETITERLAALEIAVFGKAKGKVA